MKNSSQILPSRKRCFHLSQVSGAAASAAPAGAVDDSPPPPDGDGGIPGIIGACGLAACFRWKNRWKTPEDETTGGKSRKKEEATNLGYEKWRCLFGKMGCGEEIGDLTGSGIESANSASSGVVRYNSLTKMEPMTTMTT